MPLEKRAGQVSADPDPRQQPWAIYAYTWPGRVSPVASGFRHAFLPLGRPLGCVRLALLSGASPM